MKHPTHRIIRWVQYEPWLLGWCRWEITSELHYCCGTAVSTSIAKGRWKWRGRKAQLREVNFKGGPYWSGPVYTRDAPTVPRSPRDMGNVGGGY